MRKILFITIQYTGTRFFLDLVKPVLGDPVKLSVEGAEFYHHHCINGVRLRAKELLDEGYTLITTYRPLKNTVDAWKRRFLNQDDKMRLMHEELDNWHSWVRPNATLIFRPFDRDTQDHSLKQLNFLLNSDLTTDWTPIGHNR